MTPIDWDDLNDEPDDPPLREFEIRQMPDGTFVMGTDPAYSMEAILGLGRAAVGLIVFGAACMLMAVILICQPPPHALRAGALMTLGIAAVHCGAKVREYQQHRIRGWIEYNNDVVAALKTIDQNIRIAKLEAFAKTLPDLPDEARHIWE